jgi:hypothetical protein
MLTSAPAPIGPDRVNPAIPAVINIVVAYDNLSAALWAAEALGSVRAQLPAGAESRLSPWSFATMENPAYSAEATAAAVKADLIVLAISTPVSRLPIPAETWLRTCLAGRRKAKTAVAAVFGCPGSMDGADSLRLQTVQRLAADHGCEFFAPGVAAAAWGARARRALDEAGVRDAKIV